MRKHRIALAAAIAATLISTSNAQASQTPDQIMGRIAAHHVQGWVDNKTPAPELLHRINQGDRVYVSCSVIAAVGIQSARNHGIPARAVSVVTNGKFDGYNDGHAMLELKLGGKWVLYDLDMNRVAVDQHGRRIGLAKQLKAGHDRRWRMIAHDDTRWNYAGTTASFQARLKRIEAQPLADWYDHVMGVALVSDGHGGYAYHGTGRESRRIDAVWPGVYRWVGAGQWRSLNYLN